MTAPPHIVELRAGSDGAFGRTSESAAQPVILTLDLSAGGRIAQIDVAGQPLLVPGPGSAIGWGSYPMAPWVGRIRTGRFEFGGTDYQLRLNHTDVDGTEHAIHGTVFDESWTLDGSDATHAHLHCELGTGGWPFAGTARQSITLSESAVRCELSIECQRDPFPGAIGWHPWFLKPDRLTFTPSAMYARDGIGLPTGELVEPTPGPWDDTFLNTDPVALHYSRRAIAPTVTIESDCDHWVVFDQPTHATCVEPQSGPPDALSIQRRLVTVDDPLRRWMRISWA